MGDVVVYSLYHEKELGGPNFLSMSNTCNYVHKNEAGI